ncbi:uncharacterized protein LOC111602573 [Drosophila hydei]|uniref:Uncharacterized protein LOC111602573 n=1 Tax=Drosophila hydei TaxID=7224 RepID=A0A6J2SW22_DROHY|nr:uncharacterized protein LOC111602573 [Drosophila hydei]
MAVGTLLLAVLIAAVGYLFMRLRRNMQYWQNKGISCEEPHILMGSMKGVQTERSFLEIYMKYYNKFRGTGPFAGFYWFQRPAVFILEPFLVKHILIKDFNKFSDRGLFHNPDDDPLSGQLFLLDGPKWKAMRNKLSSTFTSGKMKHMFHTVVKISHEFVEVFGDMADKSPEVEVRELMARFTTDVIGSVAFGIECCSLKDPEAEFRVMGRKALADQRHGSVGNTIMNSFPKFARRIHMKMTPEHIEKFFMRIVRETVDFREKNNVRRNDFMDQLIDLKNNRLIKSQSGEDTSLTIEEVTAQAFVFFAAGFETSSTTMGFALYELAQNVDIQNRLREECKEVLAQHNGELTYECIRDMQYLNQVISETLRLYTVLPVLNRECLEDFVVPGYPNYVIKKGMPVIIPSAAMHRDEKLYPEPNRFNPDNFEPERVKNRDSVEWIPFGDGPRNCIGMRFGEMQARIGLAMLIEKFKFSVCDRTTIPIKYSKQSFLIASDSGIYLKVERFATGTTMAIGVFLLTAVVALAGYLFVLMRRNLQHWQNAGIPCEEPSILMGSLKGVQTQRSFLEIWQAYYTKFRGTGPFAGFYWFQRPAAFILEPFLVKHILIKDFNKFTDRGFFNNPEDDPLSGQLFLLDGYKWRAMRNKLSSTFTSGKMKHMFPTVVKISHEFVEVFGDMANKSPEVEVRELMARFTTDVIGSVAFGIECSSLKDPEAEFRVMGRSALIDQRHGSLGIALLNSFPKFARRIHMKMTPEHIEKFFMRIVRETVDFREKNNVRRNDFMDQLIDLKNNRLIKSQSGEDTSLTIEEIAAQAFVFFAAGFETSSTTMGFALYELAQNVDIQDRLRKECKEVLAQHNGELTYECIRDMQYLNQVISETLRLYTVLPVLNRECLEDFVVPGYPNYVIKKGMPVIIPSAAMHRDEKLYPEPNRFNPDNFEPERVKNRDSVEWIPFGDGPRNCIGMRFGEMQARIGLAMLIEKFKFSVCDKTTIPIKYNKKSFLIASDSGIYLRVDRV